MTTQVAFLFPGQGSQAVGMGADLYASSAAARRVFEASDEALGFSLSDLCFTGPEETLRKTINAQPAIVTVSLAFLAAFQEALSPNSSSWSTPLRPAFTAGHSVGEWASLVTAGALELTEAIKQVRERGRLMDHEEELCPGSMVAIIGMEAEPLQEICQEVSARHPQTAGAHPGLGQVVIANYNAPGQIVLSGELEALNQASILAKARGAKKVMPLAVSGAFHSPVMQPAVSGLAHSLKSANMRDAAIPIISNISATPLQEAHALRTELAEQIASSVQWVRSIEYLTSAGVTAFIEIGPGKALTGMIKRITKDARTLNISNVSDIEKAIVFAREIGCIEHV